MTEIEAMYPVCANCNGWADKREKDATAKLKRNCFYFNPELKHEIIGKMAAENAVDLSDTEIDRILTPCGAPWLPRIAKMFRDCGFITEAELYEAKKQIEIRDREDKS